MAYFLPANDFVTLKRAFNSILTPPNPPSMKRGHKRRRAVSSRVDDMQTAVKLTRASIRDERVNASAEKVGRKRRGDECSRPDLFNYIPKREEYEGVNYPHSPSECSALGKHRDAVYS